MKNRKAEYVAWALVLAAALAAGPIYSDVRPRVDIEASDLADGSVTNAKVADDTLTAAKFADGDWGDVSVSSNSVTLDADTVATSELANGAVAALNMADADFGDMTCATGVCTVDRWRGLTLELCVPGSEAAGICNTFTDLANTTFTSAGNDTINMGDLANLSQFRIIANMSAGGVAGAPTVEVQCDTASNFATASLLGGAISDPPTGASIGAWTNIPVACLADDIYFRAGMGNGDGAVDPAARRIAVQFR